MNIEILVKILPNVIIATSTLASIVFFAGALLTHNASYIRWGLYYFFVAGVTASVTW